MLQWFYDTLLKPIFDFIGGLISAIGDTVVNIFNWLSDFFTSLWNFFVNLFKSLFVPGEGYFSEKVNGVTNTINSKVGVDVSTLESLQGVAKSRAAITFVKEFTLFNTHLKLDLDFIKQAQSYSQAIFMGLTSIFLCWYNYKNVMRLFGKGTVESSQSGGKE